jgi:hypothetical protein
MRSKRIGSLVAIVALIPKLASAQVEPPNPSVLEDGPAASIAERSGEVALDIGWFSGMISYAREVADPLSIGIGLWGAWEPPNSFDRNVWEPIGVAVFGRYRWTPWFHADLGIAAARYLWADDCSECAGVFAGVRSAAFVGHRFVFAGPDISFGVAHDDRHGSDLGAMLGGQIRVVLRW